MSFTSLNKDELTDVAEFFAVDVEAANDDKGPTKKELLAALAAGDEPVTWEQYNDIYLKAQGPKPEPKVEPKAEVEPEEKVSEREAEEQVLIKYERKNPTYEVVGYRFSRAHPYTSVPASVASHLVKNLKGFRVALPDEVADYYS